VRVAYPRHKDDDDFVQARTLARDVMDDAQRDRLVNNVAGHLGAGVSSSVLERAITYWQNIDRGVGDRIAKVIHGAAERMPSR